MTQLDIKRNLVEILAKISPPIMPITTLSSDAHVGDTTLHLTPLLDSQSRSRFVEGSRLSFYDATGERTYTISTVTTNGATATLETATALGVSGLLHDHPAGTKVYANLLAATPFDVSAMILLGEPLFFVTVFGKNTNRDVVPSGGFPTYNVHIQSNSLLSMPDSTVDSESWAQHLEDATITSFIAIEQAVRDNPTLITDFHEAAALSLGRDGQGQDLIRVEHQGYPIGDGGTWHYIGTLDAVFLGTAE